MRRWLAKIVLEGRPQSRCTVDAGRTWDVVTGGLPPGESVSVAFDPFDHDRMLAAMDSSRVYRSIDGGQTWHRSLDGLGHLSARVVAFHPTVPGAAYLGTGYDGVFRSVDGGRSWLPFSDGLNALSITSLAFDAAGSVVYAGTDGGGVSRRVLIGSGTAGS